MIEDVDPERARILLELVEALHAVPEWYARHMVTEDEAIDDISVSVATAGGKRRSMIVGSVGDMRAAVKAVEKTRNFLIDALTAGAEFSGEPLVESERCVSCETNAAEFINQRVCGPCVAIFIQGRTPNPRSDFHGRRYSDAAVAAAIRAGYADGGKSGRG